MTTAAIGSLFACSLIMMQIGPAEAAVLFSENFDSARPGSAYNSTLPGAGFRVTQGDVDIIGNLPNGAANGFFTCPGPGNGSNNCLDLNGNQPGAVTSAAGFNLTAGTTYDLSFNLAGSIIPNINYAMQATIGDSAPFTFSAPALNNFGTETVSYTPTISQTDAHLSFASLTDIPGNSEYGPLIDNVVLTSARPVPRSRTESALLFRQDLASASPGPNYRGALSDTGLSVTAGDVDIFGNGTGSGTAGFYSCPMPMTPNQPCIDLNGDQPGTIQTDQVFHLRAGSSYTVSFRLAGNIPNGSLSNYTLSASFGDSGPFTFSTPPDATFRTESFTYTPSADETNARLILSSDQDSNSSLYGPIITDLSIAVPEPATPWVLLSGIVALAGLGRRSADHSAGPRAEPI